MQLDRWVDHYNHERPHQAIGRVPPIERFQPAAAAPAPVDVEVPESPEAAGPVTTRRVSAKGTVSFATAIGAEVSRGYRGLTLHGGAQLTDKRGKRWRVVAQAGRDPLTGKLHQLSGSAATEREALVAPARGR